VSEARAHVGRGQDERVPTRLPQPRSHWRTSEARVSEGAKRERTSVEFNYPPTVVRLDAADRDDRVAPLLDDVGKDVLQLPNLIARELASREIVTLDKQLDAQVSGQQLVGERERVQRGRDVCQAHLVRGHSDVFACERASARARERVGCLICRWCNETTWFRGYAPSREVSHGGSEACLTTPYMMLQRYGM